MRKRYSITILSLLFVVISFAVSFAADPSQLIVVRGSDNSLWKATCVGTTCTTFTSFPGLFTSQPTVIWDENIQKYVLWGRGTDGAIWRSTFSRGVPSTTTGPYPSRVRHHLPLEQQEGVFLKILGLLIRVV